MSVRVGRRAPWRVRVLSVLACSAVLWVASGCGPSVKAAGDFTPKHSGTLTVATSEVPLVGLWKGTAGHPTGGFEFELARAFADRFGLRNVKVVIVAFDRLVQGHLDGADLALSDLTATAAREQVLDFTDSYLAATPAVLVRSDESVPDLKTAQGLRWAVGRSTTLSQFLDDTIQPSTRTLLTSSQHETTEAVEQKSVDAGLLDLPVAAAIARDSGGKLAVAGQFDSNDDVSAALPRGSGNVDAVGSAIRAFLADGTISKLAKRWLGLTINGTNADQVPLIRTEG
jgi:polar amino acid transport system substrate-binding protein